MDLSDPVVQTTDDNAEELSSNVDDSLISPYHSPQKEHLASDAKFGSGDFIHDAENNRFLANQIYSAPEKNGVLASDESPDILPLCDTDSTIAGGEGFVDRDTASTKVSIADEANATEETSNNDLKLEENEISNTTRSDSMLSDKSAELLSPEEEKEKIFAEMLASAGDTTPSEELSQTEMASISKRMEEEFRTMVMQEQQKKKLSIEGPSHAADKNLPNGNHRTVSTDLTPKQSLIKTSSTSLCKTPKAAKPSYTSRLPTSQSRTSRPNSARTTCTGAALPNTGPSASPARSIAKSRGTPTTLRLTPRNTAQNSPAREHRTPLRPATTPVQSRYRISSPRNTGISSTPLKATNLTNLQSSATPPAKRPFSSPRRPPSVQSSDSGGRCTTPNMRHVQSKIGSLQNAKHTPGGGKVKIESRRSDYSQVSAKVGSNVSQSYTPSGGKVKIESRRSDYSSVGSKCGSLANASHTPGGGKVRIESKRLNYSHVGSKCGSFANVTHSPGGGKVKVESKKLDYSNISSKCGSRDNMTHTPQGGKVKIFHAKVDTSKVESKIGSKDNIRHTPGGGKVKVLNRSINLAHVKSKCGSLDNANHVPGGGNVEIFNESPSFKETAKSKIGSLDNADHVPGGGDVRIYDEKLYFRETAAPRTDVGFNGVGSEGSAELAMST